MFAANSVAAGVPGTNWFQKTAVAGASFASVAAYGAGVYLLGGGTAYLASSIDANTWVLNSGLRFPVLTNGSTINGLVYAPSLGYFIAGSSQGGVATSADGLTWTDRTSGLSSTGWGGSSIQTFIWTGALLFAFGDTALGKVATSSDGLTWSYKGAMASLAGWPSGAGPFLSSYAAAYSGSGYMVVGYNVGDSNAYCATSSDTNTWINRPNLNSAVSGSIPRSVAWCPTISRWLVGTTDGKLASSTDGASWTLLTTPAAGAAIRCIQTVSGYIFALCSDKLMVSVDGTNWTQTTNASGVALGVNGNLMFTNTFRVSV
jgi:hypothetical protein